MLKLRVWTCTGPPPNDWELPPPASLTILAALSAISVCALRMSKWPRGPPKWSKKPAVVVPNRLETSTAGFFDHFGGPLGHFGVRFANVVKVPVHDTRSVGRERRFLGGIEAEGHNFVLVVLSVGSGNHREVVEMAAENRLR